MPRPKRPGAPEPKKRSRNGCWPCKTRKVKCDEARPTCLNCQKQGEICDYSIRLNWEGRGKQKLDSPGQANFAAGTSGPGSPNLTSPGLPMPNEASEIMFQTSYGNQMGVGNEEGQPDYCPKSLSPSSKLQDSPAPFSTKTSASEMSMIDPALAGSSHSPSTYYQFGLYDGLPNRAEYQYAQSYERYHSSALDSPSAEYSMGSSNTHQAHDGAAQNPILPVIDSSPTKMNVYSSRQNERDFIEADMLSAGRPAKRMRYRLEQDATMPSDIEMPPPLTNTPHSSHVDSQPPSLTNAVLSSSVGTPATPVSSHSDDGYKPFHSRLSPLESLDSPDLRRLSVHSLLSGPPGMPYHGQRTYRNTSNPDPQDWTIQYQDVYQDTTTWGVDRGLKDLDVGKNDDTNAISVSSPVARRDFLEPILDNGGMSDPLEFGFGTATTNNSAYESGGYYEKPVTICIPRALEPLPNKLLENPMNLLYFHHFLNHTAGCLIPHNCSSNPFRSILPQMAVQDEDLLNLMLAYSASHRARLLRHPEPATRIALWVKDIFPNLRHALDDPNEIISNAKLATAIMLASLEIISPKAFGVAVPWQKHLDTARQMIVARRGSSRTETAFRGDRVSSFLWSWFAYLDVLGSLSGVKANSTSSAWVFDYEVDEKHDYEIDCILGFTSRCVRILAKVAELARGCDIERIGPDHTIRLDYEPSKDIVARAIVLETELAESLLHKTKPCTHMQSSGEAAYQWDSMEMAATNEAFHWAGLVHLHRRVLGKPSTHSDVRHYVREIFGALYKVRKGSSAEACLLFPMFTAGCDTEDKRQREDILERIKSVERFGMTQVREARTLMEKAWETGHPWETLVAGEFFG